MNGGNSTSNEHHEPLPDRAGPAPGLSRAAGRPVTKVFRAVTNIVSTSRAGMAEVPLDLVDALTRQWPEASNHNASIRMEGFLLRFVPP